MAKIEPFRAVVYNQEKIQDLSSVVCPPYDVISSAQQERYHQLHPNNFIRILFGKDIPGEDKYLRSAELFKNWQKEKILIPDESPAIYFYSQQYTLKGEKRTRLGFIARLYLEDKASSIYTHEHTRLEPKEDRLKLLKSVKANLSPIFVLFPDKKRVIRQTYQKYVEGEKPFIDIVNGEKTAHKLWRIDSPDILEGIKSKIQDENIFIADGHHRYEVACAYRDEMKKEYGADSPEAKAHNFILAYFTNTDSSGLTILPIHRLVKLPSRPDMRGIISGLREYFEVEDVKDKARFFFLMEKSQKGAEHILGMYNSGKYLLLRLKNVKLLDKMMKDKPPEYRALDVSILNYLVLENTLGIDLDDKRALTFNQNTDELIEKADNDDSYIAFFLNPVKVQQMTTVALSGENMPSKSTFFYPKVLSGLVINKHE